MRRVPVLICLLAVASACATPAGAEASGRSRADVQRLEDEGVRDIIVARDPGLTAAARGDLRAGAGVAHVADLPLPDTEVVRAAAGGLVEAVDALAADAGVRYAEPNGIVRAASSDPLFAQLWGLENTGQDIGVAPNTVTGTVDADIDAPEAWAQSTGAGQVVAVVDSGMDAAHQDLAGAQWTNPGEVSNGVDDDLDGAVDDVHGWNVLTTTTDVTDNNGHGTHVSGTIAARKDNALGVAGVAPSAQVFPLVALDSTGNGSDASVASAFDVAGKLGIGIVNASVEAPFSLTVQAAVDRHPNTLYVLSAGNESADDDSTSSLCQIPSANVVCVGASDANDATASFSNFGLTTVDLFAPGVKIASTYIPPTCAAPCYAFLDGTSMAAPHVSGTLALMRARNPALTAPQLKAKLLATVDSKGAFAATSFSGGRLNAAGAVAASAPASVPAAAPTAPVAGASTTAAATPTATAATTAAAAAAAAPPVVASVAVAPVLGRPTVSAGALTARHPLTIRFTLDRAATVKVTIARGTKTVATATIHGRKGANRYVLRARVGGRKLAPGRYRVRFKAAGAARASTLAVTVR